MSIKRNPSMLPNRSVPDVQNKRRSWQQHISEKDVRNLVFLDESGINTNLTRIYARAKKRRTRCGHCANKHASLYNHPIVCTAEWGLCLYSLFWRDNGWAFSEILGIQPAANTDQPGYCYHG